MALATTILLFGLEVKPHQYQDQLFWLPCSQQDAQQNHSVGSHQGLLSLLPHLLIQLNHTPRKRRNGLLRRDIWEKGKKNYWLLLIVLNLWNPVLTKIVQESYVAKKTSPKEWCMCKFNLQIFYGRKLSIWLHFFCLFFFL